MTRINSTAVAMSAIQTVSIRLPSHYRAVRLGDEGVVAQEREKNNEPDQDPGNDHC